MHKEIYEVYFEFKIKGSTANLREVIGSPQRIEPTKLTPLIKKALQRQQKYKRGIVVISKITTHIVEGLDQDKLIKLLKEIDKK